MKKQEGKGVNRDEGRLWDRSGWKYPPRSGAMASLRGRDGQLWGKREKESVGGYGAYEACV